jgi:UDP-N-acetylmuramate-alanine ligase
VATALLNRASAAGALRERGDAAFVFEVDEAAFPQVVADLRPRVIVITNLFRDQLDRYGEVDLVAERWRDSLKTLPASTTLALNADDPAVAALADSFAGRVIYFGVEGRRSAANTPSVCKRLTRAPAHAAVACWSMRAASTATSATGHAPSVVTPAQSQPFPRAPSRWRVWSKRASIWGCRMDRLP